MNEAPPTLKSSISYQSGAAREPREGGSPINSSMVTVRGLVKRIGAQEILRGVDLDVGHGETLAIIGRSGGGKSVLLKQLVGLMRPDSGEIWVEGQDITKLKERQLAIIRQKVGILFQGAAKRANTTRNRLAKKCVTCSR
jgi:ABC-type transporter Mla maintaining outer membrane lipid asymmetry ATPase subunit MlaF